MDSRNVSFQLNNLGPWSDPLLSGILGSASSVNMLEPLSTALPVIAQQPGAFMADHLLSPQQPAAAAGDQSATTGQGPAPITPWGVLDPFDPSGTEPSNVVQDTIDRIAGIFQGTYTPFKEFTPADKTTAESAIGSWVKGGIVIVVALIMLVFGLWILLAPTVKPIVVGAAKDAAA